MERISYVGNVDKNQSTNVMQSTKTRNFASLSAQVALFPSYSLLNSAHVAQMREFHKDFDRTRPRNKRQKFQNSQKKAFLLCFFLVFQVLQIENHLAVKEVEIVVNLYREKCEIVRIRFLCLLFFKAMSQCR